MVLRVPCVQTVPVSGFVTTNGPVVPSTLTVVPASVTPSTPSRRMIENCIVRVVVCRLSPDRQVAVPQVSVAGGTLALFST
jgi:hypothetical protein